MICGNCLTLNLVSLRRTDLALRCTVCALLSVDFADEVGFEGARRVVPLETLAVSVPQLEAVFLLAVLVAEVVGLAGVPVGERQRSAGRHPEEVALLALVGAGRPEMLVSET